ncbi:MAG TPA: RNA 2',3'-cyclic phosphodiesterase [bacterium]|nr:RNA 2',3'-cyclic phosphodiesterase [bacterium]HOC88807.1 RNA 2',3'-cyclic phosphodiesterase [bacterium]HOZ21280.1 RNA 2',3'-cyclic phosphodiesterase [bacterium]
MATLRTFICIELPEQVRERISELQHQLSVPGSGVSWTRPEGIHLTLKFLGDIEPPQVEAIAGAVERASQGIAPFRVTVAGTGGFPNLNRPRVLWVGIENSASALFTIQSQIERELVGLGYPREERRFSPHLTLGRVKAPEAVQEICRELLQRSFAPVTFTAGSIIIMRSDLKPDGALYTPLRTIEL